MKFSNYYNYYTAHDIPVVSDENENNRQYRDRPVKPLPNPGEGGPVNGGSSMPDSNMPVIPLPNPGEGGPVNGGSSMPDSNIPMIPLPNPGEGGPIGPGSGIPVIPLPNPGEGGPVGPGNGIPVIPLPNPGEGGPVGPGNGTPVIPLPNPGEGGPVVPGFPSTIITVLPRPIVPCFFCNSNTFGEVRFLNAATGYNPFHVSINNQTVVNNLDYAEVSEYGRVSSGYQTVTVTGQNGYIYITKQLQINSGSKYTVAIVNTASGLDLAVITDSPCNVPANFSCLRACNLSYNSGPLSLLLSNGYSIFRNIQFMDVTSYSRLMPGRYQFLVARNSHILVSSEINVRSNSNYTIYMFNWNNSPDAIRTLIVEDRK